MFVFTPPKHSVELFDLLLFCCRTFITWCHRGLSKSCLISFLPAGPLRQTFTHNPLEQKPPIAAAAAAASAKDKSAGSKTRPWKDTIG